MKKRARTRSYFAPEVVQTSTMDCGPAALTCLLQGFGISASYGRLREACQTDVDGTSIDTLEEIANVLGLDAKQVMLPIEHVLSSADSLPAIVVVRLPNGFTHFLVVWREHGDLVQLMDPASGRRWVRRSKFLDDLYVHTMPVPAAMFREFASSATFAEAVEQRLERLGALGPCRDLLRQATEDPNWRAMATLDAAIRMTQMVVDGGGLSPGRAAAAVVNGFFTQGLADPASIPNRYWTARLAPAVDEEEHIFFRGAVAVQVSARDGEDRTSGGPPQSPELAAALSEPPMRPVKEIFGLVREDGVRWLGLFGAALAATTCLAGVEVLLLRGLLNIGASLTVVEQRLGGVVVLLLFAIVMLGFECSTKAGLVGIGRRLETRLRIAFLRKIPKLEDRYFQSRPNSDMAERGHQIHAIRELPAMAGEMLQLGFDLLACCVGIAWLDIRSAPFALLAVALAVGVPLAAQPILVERDMRARSHLGAMSRFYLDAMLGLVPIRVHGSERSIRREHESLLVDWVRAARALVRASVTVEAVQALGTYAVTIALVLTYFARTAHPEAVLLLTYWALKLPAVGAELALAVRQYPRQRNAMLRLLEPLGAPEADLAPDDAPKHVDVDPASRGDPSLRPNVDDQGKQAVCGIDLRMEGVTVVAAGHTILEKVHLHLQPGAHVAIVGASGAGKSSLAGTLLGWYRPSSGRVLVDGRVLDARALDELRRTTVWVDPAVHLWNRTLIENLRYGAERPPASYAPILRAADLHSILESMPDGLQTPLGEGGAFVSGGEGQRVRFGRGLLRTEARLVILDEPFRGLDRAKRGLLLERARAWFADATLLCITHDVEETLAFERVLVIDGGHLVEDGSPHELAARDGSRYGVLLEAERRVRRNFWAHAGWRHVRLEGGHLVGESAAEHGRGS